MYELNGTISTSSSTTIPTTSSTSTSSVSISTPFITGIPAGWSYDGCWVDGLNGRILNDQLPDNDALTTESCVQSCAAAGYTIAGSEYSIQCFVVMPFIMVERSQQIKRIAIWHAEGIQRRYVAQEIDCPCILLEPHKSTSHRVLRKLGCQAIGHTKGVFSKSIPLRGNFRSCGNPCHVVCLATWMRWNFTLVVDRFSAFSDEGSLKVAKLLPQALPKVV
jgi:WSC domain